MGFYAGALPHEGQRAAPGGQRGWQTLGIAAALQFYAGERSALFLGLDHAAGLAVHVEQVVGKPKPGVEREFADGDAGGSVDVGIRDIADVPTGCN